MKGIVFTEFLEMVEASYGLQTVDTIIENASLPSEGAYTAVGTYDFNEMVINGTKDPQTLYLTIPNVGGGSGGNVMLEETFSLTVINAENFVIKGVDTELLY